MGMNVFRVLGDLCHYTAIVTIFIKIITSQSCKGISGKTQILYLLVFLSRYIDIFFNFISFYNTGIKIFFIVSSLTNIYLVTIRYKGTISNDLDNFRIEFLIATAAILAMLLHHEFNVIEVLWAFSGINIHEMIKFSYFYLIAVYLESVAILPQLSVTSQGKTSEVDKVILLYLSSLASHKIFYILNWMYRYHNEGYYDIIAVVAGLVQAGIYINFFVMFVIKKFTEMKIESSV